MKNVPEKIYLQVDCDGETPEDFKELEVSWCSDKIHDTDIEYIRKDIYDALEIRFIELGDTIDDILSD